MTWPPKIPQSMPQVWWDFFKAIFARIDAITPKDGKGIRVIDASDGAGRSVNLWGAEAGTTAAALRSLQLMNTGEEGIYRITYGTVSGLSDPFSPGDSPQYTRAVTSGHKVFIVLSVSYDEDLGRWDDNTLSFGSAAAVPAATADTAYLELGSVSAEGVTANALNGSLSHVRCGDEENYSDRWGAL